MSRLLNKNQKGDNYYWEYTTDDNSIYIEIPFKENETTEESSKRIDDAITSTIIERLEPRTCVDVIYVDKEVVRRDYSIRTAEGSAVIDKLESEFPNFVPDYRRALNNAVAEYGAYREPYANSSLSFYDFQIFMPEAIQTEFNVSYEESELKPWYGLKFDLVTREVLLKAVVLDFNGGKPELPVGHNILKNYYAVTHDQNGSASEWVDCYVFATKSEIKRFCLDKNLDYPLPEDSEMDSSYEAIWNWGFVFNTETLEYGPVKAYARYYLPDVIGGHSFATRN